MTETIGRALEERLQRLESEDKSAEERFLAKMRKHAEAFAAEFRASGETKSGHEMIDELYDENGLPR